MRGGYVLGHIDGLEVVIKPILLTDSSNFTKVIPRAVVQGALEILRLVCGSMDGIVATVCRAVWDG
jgi:hypothetical protein